MTNQNATAPASYIVCFGAMHAGYLATANQLITLNLKVAGEFNVYIKTNSTCICQNDENFNIHAEGGLAIHILSST